METLHHGICRICGTSKAAALLQELLRGAGFARAAKTVGASILGTRRHVKNCLSDETLQAIKTAALERRYKPAREAREAKHAARQALQAKRRVKHTAKEAACTCVAGAQHEAENLLAMATAVGSSVEAVRKGIPISSTELLNLRKFASRAEIAQAIRFRAAVLKLFDQLARSPQSFAEIERRATKSRAAQRERWARENQTLAARYPQKECEPEDEWEYA